MGHFRRQQKFWGGFSSTFYLTIIFESNFQKDFVLAGYLLYCIFTLEYFSQVTTFVIHIPYHFQNVLNDNKDIFMSCSFEE